MIRGVNRYTIEVNRTGSPYFERAICFVRPEFTSCDKVDLHRAAKQMLGRFDGDIEVEIIADHVSVPKSRKNQLLWLPYLVTGSICAAVGIIVGILA